MCGIAGIFSLNSVISETLIHEMTRELIHRGPDAGNIFKNTNNTCFLGHRRLSIIDLNESANQPMTSSCGRYVIVFNGEIYNYKELRSHLEKTHGIVFKTNSDTEVLLELYIKEYDFVHKLNGMFSFAIYDMHSHAIEIFRDRLGKKPLYFYKNEGFLAFASELKSIKTLVKTFGKFSLNKYAIHQYFRLGYIHEPNTVFNEVLKLSAGSYLQFSEKTFRVNKYWSIEDKVSSKVISDYKQAKTNLEELLQSSVDYRLISDVPYGVFLSGGVDSSIVAAYAQAARSQPINSFSIGFKEAKYNESEYARNVANHIGLNHHEFTVSYDDAIALTETFVDVYDEPYADASGIPTLLVSELARKHVTMVLTGDGGDEQFLGYGMYTWAKRLELFNSSFKRNIALKILKTIPNNRFKRVAQMFDYENKEHLLSHIFSVEQHLFTTKDLNTALNSSYIKQLIFSDKYFQRNLSSVEKQSFFDLEYYLNGDLLVKVDRATMHHALEARSPLLDYRIVEYSLNLDEHLKINGKTAKFILKELLYEKVPKMFFDRPKWGFGLPIRYWLKDEMRHIAEKYLNAEILEKHKILKSDYVNDLWLKYLAGDDYLFNKIWAIICLNIWLTKNEEYFNKPDDL